MGSYQTKINNLIEYSVSTFNNNHPEDVQSNARKAIESFCKVIILHHYGERGEAIINSQDSEWNSRLKVRNKKFGFTLSMLLKVVIESDYSSKIDKSKKIELERSMKLIIFKGNSSAHESSPIRMNSHDTAITHNILTNLLNWLFVKFLEIEIPDKLIVYIGRFDIFLSYRRTDTAWIEVLKENLKAQGYTLFVDRYQMIGGENIKQRLRDAISKSACGVVVYPKKDDYEWIAHEIEWMREREQKDSTFRMISVVMHTSEHRPDNGVVYIDFTKNKYEIAFNELICSIKGIPPLKSHIQAKLKLPTPPNSPKEHPFVSGLIEELESQKVIILFSQDFTEIERYYQEIKHQLKECFRDSFYKISIPSFTKSRKKYFRSIAKCCGITSKIKELQDWRDAIELKLQNSSKTLLFVTNLEDGHDEFNREFATTLRSLHYEYPNQLYILLVGRKTLASLVLQEGDLSPLKSVGRELFFPTSI